MADNTQGKFTGNLDPSPDDVKTIRTKALKDGLDADKKAAKTPIDWDASEIPARRKGKHRK